MVNIINKIWLKSTPINYRQTRMVFYPAGVLNIRDYRQPGNSVYVKGH